MPIAPEGFKQAVICARQADIMKALRGVIHYNNTVKDQFKLPQPLLREIEQAIQLHEGNVLAANKDVKPGEELS